MLIHRLPRQCRLCLRYGPIILAIMRHCFASNAWSDRARNRSPPKSSPFLAGFALVFGSPPNDRPVTSRSLIDLSFTIDEGSSAPCALSALTSLSAKKFPPSSTVGSFIPLASATSSTIQNRGDEEASPSGPLESESVIPNVCCLPIAAEVVTTDNVRGTNISR
jgi:hypothetical protein